MGVLENLAKNPAVLGIAAVGIIAFIFRDKISDFLSNITGGAETANLLGENLLSNLQGTQDLLNNLTSFLTTNPFENFEFPTFEFPTFEFPNIFGQPEPQPPTPGPISDPDFPLGGVETPEGCEILPNGTISCPTPPTFDVCDTFPELCTPPPIPPMDPGLADEPSDAELFAQDFPGDTAIPPPSEAPFVPPVTLPPGFVGSGPSFEGGSITEIPLCNMSVGQIAAKFGISASAAADMKFIECEESNFDFGTNTGSGFGPGDIQTGPIVTGGATLESEEKRAACLTCELFGLNCGICSGSI